LAFFRNSDYFKSIKGNSAMKNSTDKSARGLKDETEQFVQDFPESSSNGDASKSDNSQDLELRTLKDDLSALKIAFENLSSDVRRDSKNIVNENASTISGAISNTAGKISDTAAGIANNVSAKVSQAAGSMSATVSDAGANLGRHATEVSNQAASGAKSVSAELEAFTQRSPTLALACAVGVGMLLGNLARPSR
jgi:ElaB/YqjD/DUF883 family membrane-anchored ribosome-binding protein